MICGIHLIWTTYGTWLPGDCRGHWSALFDAYGNIVEQGGKLNMADAVTRERARQLMTESPKLLNSDEIVTVATEIGRHVAPHGPPAWAAAIEPNHVHLLVGPLTEDVQVYVGRLKGRTSSEVGKLTPNAHRERVWTSGYWKVFLFDLDAVVAVTSYIESHNLRNGLPAAPYPWIAPIPI
jgi:REP element-mobilizing transposase RayT